MLAYLGTFGISIGLTFWAESLQKKEKVKESALCLFLALLLVVLLAGLRDYTVGTDTLGYLKWIETAAKYDTFLEYLNSWYTGREVLSCGIAYVAGKLNSAHLFFLAFAAAIYGGAMTALVMVRETVSLPYAWAAYLFFMYGISLNQIRQSAAVTLVLCAFAFLQRKKYVAFFALLVMAYLFHLTALLALVILILYLILQKWDTKEVKTVIIAAILLFAVFAVPILRLVLETGIFGDRFAGYLNSLSGSPFSIKPVIVRLPFFIMPLFFYREFAQEEKAKSYTFHNQDADFLLILLFIEMVLAILRTVSAEIYRMSFYFETFRCMAIGRMMHTLEKNPDRKKWTRLVGASLFFMFVMIWLYQIVLQQNDWTFPYTSESLGISPDPLAVMIDRWERLRWRQS